MISENRRDRVEKFKKVGMSAGVILSVLFLISPWEGTEYEVYLDPIGIPTVCTGTTGKDLYNRDIKLGYSYTQEECDAMLSRDVFKFERVVLSKVDAYNSPNAVIDNRFISEYEKAAIISFVYNVGSGNFTKSTLLRKLNRGDHTGACDELVRWVYANGKKLRGLVSRRKNEREWCAGEVGYNAKETLSYINDK